MNGQSFSPPAYPFDLARFVGGTSTMPRAILLDLKLPKVSGLEVDYAAE